MDFRKLEYFLKVAECLSFSRAAELIPVSHQALSKQIRLLEEELGVSLFNRTTSQVVLTEAGNRLYAAFRPIMDKAYKEYENILKYVSLRKSYLHVGYFNALSFNYIVHPVIDFIKEIQSDLNIEVFAGDVGDVRQRLLDDKIDLLVTVTPNPDNWEGLSIHILDSFPLKLIVSSSHPWFNRENPVTEKDLREEKFLHYQTGYANFMEHMKVAERVPILNYDNYMNRLYSGDGIGVIANIYSQREGDFRLLELPDKYKADIFLIAAHKKEHPLKDILVRLEDY